MTLHGACIFLFMNIVLAKVAREPYCPPCPSCEKRLLERVIRNERAMENLQTKIGIKLNNAIKPGMEKLQKEMVIKLNNAIKTAMENISNAVSEMTQKATMTGLQLKKESEILKDQLTIPFIYFHSNSPAEYNLSSGQVVVYTNVRVNEGLGYDPKTGIFTVSVPGLYLFTVHYSVGPSTYAVLAITHQGIQIQPSGIQLASGNYATSSMHVFIRAAMSDQIWVISTYSASQLSPSGDYNSFTGSLIHM